MADRMENQRPADEQGRREERGLSRRDEPQSLGRYGGWASPFELMRRFSEDVDRMFSSFGFGGIGAPYERTGRELARPSSSMGMSAWAPSVDVFARGDDLMIRADVPGINPDDVEIETEGNNLIIRGESRSEKEDKDKGYWYTERRYGSFYRTIPLPQGVNADNAQAQINNGVLEITLPGAAKTLQPQRRRIQIQGAGQQAGAQDQIGGQIPNQTQTGNEQSTTT